MTFSITIKQVFLMHKYKKISLKNKKPLTRNPVIDIRWNELSASLLKNNGRLIVGKISINNTETFFQFMIFDQNNINCELFLDKDIHALIKKVDQRLLKGMLYPQPFSHFNTGPFPAQLNANNNTVLISDFTTFPFNEGFFVIKNNELLETQSVDRQWALVYNNNTNSITPLLIEKTDIPDNIRFGFSVNPVLVNGSPLGLTDKITGTNEILPIPAVPDRN